jgi:hypothetical protein
MVSKLPPPGLCEQPPLVRVWYCLLPRPKIVVKKIATPKSEVFKDVSEVKPSKNIFLGVALMEPSRAELVILGAFLFIAQDRISFADRLEFLFSVLAFIPIGMKLKRELPVGPFLFPLR